VVAAGPDCRDFAVGDRVASMHRDFCGRCENCRSIGDLQNYEDHPEFGRIIADRTKVTAEERRETARHLRVFPGEGAHSEALAQFIARLDTIGYVGNYSFDVYNDDFLQMPPETVAMRARRAAVWLAETVLRRALPVPNIERLRAASRA